MDNRYNIAVWEYLAYWKMRLWYEQNNGRVELNRLNLLELKGIQRVYTRELMNTSNFEYQDWLINKHWFASERQRSLEQQDKKSGKRRWNLVELLEGI